MAANVSIQKNKDQISIVVSDGTYTATARMERQIPHKTWGEPLVSLEESLACKVLSHAKAQAAVLNAAISAIEDEWKKAVQTGL